MNRCARSGLALLFGTAGALASEPTYYLTAGEIRRLADEAAAVLDAPIETVVDKTGSPTGDRRDYVSYARYYWPDPTQPDGLPFVPRDGESNHAQVAQGDHRRLWNFCGTVEKLAARWQVYRDEAAARRAGEWLRAWFVSPGTRMNPHLQYAQVRRGHDGNRGTEFGVLDARCLAQAIDALRLLESSPALGTGDMAQIQEWFTAYFDWLLTTQSRLESGPGRNNHSTWFLAQAIPIARFLGREREAVALAENGKRRIAEQIAADGRQPDEIERVNSLSYSAFNLEGYVRVARAAAGLGIDLWSYTAPSGASLTGAIEYLRPYNPHPERWPHPQQATVAPGFLDALLAEAEQPRASATPSDR